MKLPPPEVWNRPPEIIQRLALAPLDLVLLDSLGAPADLPVWQRSLRTTPPWTITVDEIGTVGTIDRSTRARGPLPWYEPGPTPADPPRNLDSPPLEGMTWISRIVDRGRVLVEDRWSASDGGYRRTIDAGPDQALAERLARFVFDHGRWGRGRPKSSRFDPGVVEAILEFRATYRRDPTQQELLANALIHDDQEIRSFTSYEANRDLQRALDGSPWWEMLLWARKLEAERADHPGKLVISGFVSCGRFAVPIRADSGEVIGSIGYVRAEERENC
jgi:hypothetical protein